MVTKYACECLIKYVLHVIRNLARPRFGDELVPLRIIQYHRAHPNSHLLLFVLFVVLLFLSVFDILLKVETLRLSALLQLPKHFKQI